jgi:hypothetical protein
MLQGVLTLLNLLRDHPRELFIRAIKRPMLAALEELRAEDGTDTRTEMSLVAYLQNDDCRI